MKKTNYNNTLKVRMSEELVRVVKSQKIIKKTNYNKRQEIRISEELNKIIKSSRIQNGKMLQNDLKHSNFSQMVRALIINAYENRYTKTWLKKMFDWDNIP